MAGVEVLGGLDNSILPISLATQFISVASKFQVVRPKNAKVMGVVNFEAITYEFSEIWSGQNRPSPSPSHSGCYAPAIWLTRGAKTLEKMAGGLVILIQRAKD